MVELIESAEFEAWIRALRDRMAIVRILTRLERLREGNAGDVKAVGAGISELRISYGPGYRVYFMQRGEEIVILLSGGDKSTQKRDIAKAKAIAERWR